MALAVAGLATAPGGARWAAAVAIAAAAVAAVLAPRGRPGSAPPLAPAVPALGAAPPLAPAVPPLGAALVAALAVACGAAAGDLRLAAIDRPAVPPGTVLDGRAVLLERPRAGAFGERAVIRFDSGLRALARFGRPPPRAVGTILRVRAVVRRPRPSRGGFDYDAFLRGRGVLRQVSVERFAVAGRRGGVGGAVDRLRERSEAALARGRAPGRAALARGMVLGQDEAVDEGVREDFRRSGLAHLLAASGQNVMLLCALALPLLALAGVRHPARGLALIGLIAVYVPLAGAGPSIVRAGIMGAAAIAALLAGRPSSRLHALLLAAALTLAWNPRVSADPGWQLSFAAVAGIAAAAAPLRARIARRLGPPSPATAGGRLAHAAAEGLAVTLAATLATAPLMAHHFGSVSVAALPANLLALPAVAPVMWIGMAQAAVGQAGAPGLAAAGLLGALQDPLLAWIAGVGRRLAEPAWAQAGVELGRPGVLLAFAGLAAAIVALRRWPGPAADVARLGRRGLLGAGALVLAGGLVAATPPPPPRGLRIDFLDVGQGDATLVRHGGAAVLFDGGPPEAHVAAKLRALGVRRLGAVVATHQSRDHQGGLGEVLRRLPADLLLDGGDGTGDPAFRALIASARERGVRVVKATAGLSLRVGALRVRVLAPQARGGPAGGGGGDPNARAVVALVEADGFRLLLTADAESPSLLPLRLPRVHAMKVPHHGSADPGLPSLLARVRPRIAAIEVGAGNTYGHPAPSTLRALRSVPHVYRTDRHGTVSVDVEDGAARVGTGR